MTPLSLLRPRNIFCKFFDLASTTYFDLDFNVRTLTPTAHIMTACSWRPKILTLWCRVILDMSECSISTSRQTGQKIKYFVCSDISSTEYLYLGNTDKILLKLSNSCILRTKDQNNVFFACGFTPEILSQTSNSEPILKIGFHWCLSYREPPLSSKT